MHFTDLFIRRPVMAMALSLLILILGLQALFALPVREYPQLTNTTITVSTSYYGASADVVQGFLTQPLQASIAEADNIDYIDSTSSLGTSSISVVMKVGANPDTALSEIMAKVNSVKSSLPPSAEEPQISRSTGDSTAIMYIGFSSDAMDTAQLADYLRRQVQTRLVTVPGLAKAEVYGPSLAMRVWLDPVKMAKYDLTATEVKKALISNNYQAAAGQIKSRFSVYDIEINTDLKTPDEFRNMIIKRTSAGTVRLSDIAQIELTSARNTVIARLGGVNAVIIAVETAPAANPLEVAKKVRSLLPSIDRSLPASVDMYLAYDASDYINTSIDEVIQTIAEASIIVFLVIYLFMGNLRAMLIPVIAIPFSLIGVCLAMQMLGFSINLLTLLAMILAIGLVVDDAIVVVENVERHLQQGQSPMKAALLGTREIAFPVILMTLTLVAVFAPIALLEGVTGSLFKEFALTLAGSVVVSGIVALTLSPMMCSKLLKHNAKPSRFERWVHLSSQKIETVYKNCLTCMLKHYKAVLFFSILVLISLPMLLQGIPTELAPREDKGAFMLISNAPNNNNIDYIDSYMKKYSTEAKNIEGYRNILTLSGIPGANQGLAIVMEAPWGQRESSQMDMIGYLTTKLKNIAGMSVGIFPMPALPGAGGGLPVQIVLKSHGSYQELLEKTNKLKEKADNSGLFVFTRTDTKFDAGRVKLIINRDKVREYDVSMQDLADTLALLLGDGRVNYINISGRSYEVIPQVPRTDRQDPQKLSNYYVKAVNGTLIPISSLVDINVSGALPSLRQMDQANAVTLSGVVVPGVAIGEAIKFLETEADKVLSTDNSYDFKGESRQYNQESGALYASFALAICIIFLMLAMQFESWRDPLVIMCSVPLAISGALLVMAWGIVSMNIYTQIGLLTLIGLITKHGILMCEVAKVKRRDNPNLSRVQAIIEAASIRLRPILMTTISMMVGVAPLMLAAGAGASARQSIGIVIFSGLGIGTLFTLFVLPAVYCVISEKKIHVTKEN